MNDYCVYFYVREDGSPYYVGIGKKKRPFAKHAHRSHNIDFKPKNNDQILIIHQDLTCEEAKSLEIEYIVVLNSQYLIQLNHGHHQDAMRQYMYMFHLHYRLN